MHIEWIVTVYTPASLASSNLGIPLILLYFTDEHFLFNCVWALNLTQLSILSTIPQLVACRIQRQKKTKQQHCEVKEIQLFYVMNCLKAFNLCLLTALINFSDRGHLDPKFLVWSVMFSFVWESKEGFSIRAFTNTQMWFFTWGKEGEKGQSI